MRAEASVKVAKKRGANLNPFDVVETMVECADRWVSEVQRAKSDRAGIAALEHVQTERIHAQRAVLLKALDLTFDERRENFRRLFDGLDSAMADGDAAQTVSVLESITDLARRARLRSLRTWRSSSPS